MFRETLKALGDYATLSAQGTHYLKHEPEQAVRNIMRTCQLTLSHATEPEKKDGPVQR